MQLLLQQSEAAAAELAGMDAVLAVLLDELDEYASVAGSRYDRGALVAQGSDVASKRGAAGKATQQRSAARGSLRPVTNAPFVDEDLATQACPACLGDFAAAQCHCSSIKLVAHFRLVCLCTGNQRLSIESLLICQLPTHQLA